MASSPDVRTSDAQHYVDFDEYIEYQLTKTRAHIKSTEIFTTLTWAGTLFLGYLLAFVVCDQWVIAGGFGELSRVLLLSLLFVVLTTMIVRNVILPLLKRVNALYAARVIESADPALRSSLLNFVDLRDAGKPAPKPVLRSIEKRAALNLAHFDVEQAVDRRSLLHVCYLLLGVVVVAALYTVFSPKDVLTSLKRALLPTANAAVATQTTISDVTPGDDTLPARSLLTVEALIGGRVPEAVGLYYTTADHKYVEQLVDMRRQDDTFRFRGVIAGENGRGLLQDVKYYIAAGDARTREFEVHIVQPPSATVDEIRYTYPSYMNLSPRTQADGHIDGWEGTQVTLTATTNMPVKSARLLYADTEGSRAKGEERTLKVVDGTKLQGEWKLKNRDDGTFARFYRIECTTAKGETDPDPTEYTILIRPDLPPDVALLAPTSELMMPANGVVPLLIQASDPDFLLRSVAVRAEKGNEMLIEPSAFIENDLGVQTYRGSYDFKLAPLNLQAGDNIEFWIEAKDNKQPIANRKNTPRLKIRITAPVSQQKAEEDLAKEKKDQEDQLAKADSPLNPEATDLSPTPAGQKPEEMPEQKQDPRKQPEKKPANTKDGAADEQAERDDNPGKEGQDAEGGNQGAGGKQKKQKFDAGGEDDTEVLEKLLDRDKDQEPPKQDPAQEGQDDASSGGSGSQKGKSQPKDESGAESQSSPESQGGSGKPSGKSSPGKKSNPASSGEKSESQPGQKQPGQKQPDQKQPDDKQSSEAGSQGASSSEKKDKAAADKTKPGGKEGKPESTPGATSSDDKQSGKPNAGDKEKSGEKEKSGDKADPATGEQKPGGTEKKGPKSADDRAGDKTDEKPSPKPGEKKTDKPGDKQPGEKEPGDKGAGEQGKGDPGAGGKESDKKPAKEPPAGDQSAGKQGGGMKPEGDKDSGDKQAADKSQSGGDDSKPAKADAIPKGEQSGESGGEKTAPRESKNKPDQRQQEGLEGEEKPAEPSPNSTKKKATGDETGKGVPDDKPDAEAPKAKNKLDKDPGAKGARRDKPRPAEPTPDAKPGKEPGDATENASPNPGEAKPATKRKTDDAQSVKSDKPGDAQTPQDVKNPPEKQSGQPESGEDELKGKGRPQGQKSDQPQGGEAGGSKQNEQGNQGGNESGAGDRSQKPGKSEQAGKPTGKPGEEKGTGSTKKPSQEGSKPGAAGEGKPSDQPAGNQGGGKPGASKPDSKSVSKPDAQGGSPSGEGQPGDGGKPKPSGGSSSTGGGNNSDQPGESDDREAERGGQGGGQQSGTGNGNGESQPEEPEKPNLEYAREASNLVLQRLKRQLDRGEVDQKLLDELGWTKEEMRRFVDRLEKQVSDSDNDTSPDATARRMQFEETLKGLKVRRKAASQTGDSSRQRRTQQVKQARQLPVPAEYREQYDAYTKSLSKQGGENPPPAPAKSSK